MISRLRSSVARAIASVAGVVAGGGGSTRLGGGRRPKIRSFYGSTLRPEDEGFLPRVIGPNQLTSDKLDRLVARVRYLAHSDPVIAPAGRVIVNNVCGPDGIMLRPDTGNDALNRRLSDLWYSVADAVDADRSMSDADMQRQACRELFEAGHVLAHFAVVDEWRGVSAGPAIELLPCEQIPLGAVPIGISEVPEGHTVRLGVELDELKRRAAYWVYRELPSDSTLGSFSGGSFSAGSTFAALPTELVRLESRDAIMLSTPGRTGQLRGWPLPVAAVQVARDKDSWLVAGIQQAVLGARFGIHFEGYQGPEAVIGSPAPGGRWPTDSEGEPMASMASMINITAGPEGTRPHTIGKDTPSPMIVEGQTLLARHICACIGASYNESSADWSKISFATARAQQVAERRGYRALQTTIFRKTSAELYARWVRQWVLTGELREFASVIRAMPARKLVRCEPILPGYEPANPAQDAAATQTLRELRAMSLTEAVAARGRHIEDVMNEMLDEEQLWQRLRAARQMPPESLLSTMPPPAGGTDAPARGRPLDDRLPDAGGDGSGDKDDDGEEGGQDDEGEEIAAADVLLGQRRQPHTGRFAPGSRADVLDMLATIERHKTDRAQNGRAT